MARQLITETETFRRVEAFMGQKLELPEGFDPYVDDSIRDVCVGLPVAVFTELKALATTHSMGVHDFVRHLIDEALAAKGLSG